MAIVHTSFHNGTAYRREHNIRMRAVTDKEAHIDRHGKYEIWHDEKLSDAYERIFGDAIREYNEKQKRKDRRIDTNYLKTIQEDKNKHPVYEVIVGVYAQEETVIHEREARDILREFYDNWQKRNPNLEIVGAYYHADEQGSEPHLHIDYVPVAKYTKHGAKLQNGLVKALEQQGIELQKSDKENNIPWKTAQTQWQDKEREVFDELCRARGYTVEHPVIEGKKEKVEHLDTQIYKLQAQAQELMEQIKTTLEGREDTVREVTEAKQKLEKVYEETQKAENKLAELSGEIRLQKLAKKKDPNVKHKLLGNDKVEVDWYDWQAMQKTFEKVKTAESDMQKAKEELAKQQELTKALQKREEASRTIVQREQNLERANKRLESIINARVEERVDELFKDTNTNREGRMEAFLDKYSKDGKTLLQLFKEQEHQRHISMNRGWER